MPRVRCCTWNVCGLDVCALDAADTSALDGCLAECLPRYAGAPAEVICVGIVEVVELNPQNVVRDSLVVNSQGRGSRVDAWRRLLAARLEGYECRCESGLVGVALFVFARPGAVSSATAAFVSTGLAGGALGNKGACVARLGVGGRTVAVVHAHLSSDLARVEDRNREYHLILGARLGADGAATSAARASIAGLMETLWLPFGGEHAADPPPPTFRVVDADVVIWQGDLNYRLDDPSDLLAASAEPTGFFARAFAAVEPFPEASSPRARLRPPPPSTAWADVRAEIAAEDWPALRKRDQLLKAIADAQAFAGFREAPLAFPPTYKMERGDGADGLAYAAKRRPAWCDRVLWKAAIDVSCERYDAIPCGLSDHNPVVASLSW